MGKSSKPGKDHNLYPIYLFFSPHARRTLCASGGCLKSCYNTLARYALDGTQRDTRRIGAEGPRSVAERTTAVTIDRLAHTDAPDGTEINSTRMRERFAAQKNRAKRTTRVRSRHFCRIRYGVIHTSKLVRESHPPHHC